MCKAVLKGVIIMPVLPLEIKKMNEPTLTLKQLKKETKKCEIRNHKESERNK